MVSRHSFVICRTLEIRRRHFFVIAGVHHHVSRARSVRRALHIFRRRFLLSIFLHRQNFHFRFRQPPEHRRQLHIHLVDVLLVQIQNFFSRMDVYFGIRRQRGAEALQIRVAQIVDHLQHLGLNDPHLLQANLVNFFRRQVRRSHLFYVERVSRRAVRQRPFPRFGPAFRRVLVAHERRELHIRRQHSVADRRQARFAQTLLVRRGNRRRKFVKGLREG